MTRPGIEPRSPGPLANTLTAWPMSGNIYISTRFRLAIILSIPISILSTLKDLFRVLVDPWKVHWSCLIIFDIKRSLG